jgi:RND superfamily putative drug exporter
MVEARERGMSTAEAIRIGTATTGRLITAAAMVLAVVAASFVFSDLVMMKYLAFGLMAALLLDATVVRMFLVPSVMKLLGDDCWWAPRWARRLQNRMGLGEIDLPDERKRPSVNGRPSRPPVAAASLVAAPARLPHDPTHPGPPPEPSRPRPASQPEVRPANELPSGANTTRIQSKPSQPTEAKTSRLSVPSVNTVPAPDDRAASGRERPADQRGPGQSGPPTRPPSPAPPPPAPAPSDGQTKAMPVPANRENNNDPADPADPTAALPAMRPDADDSDAATEKLTARGQSDQSDNGDNSRPRRRGGGGLSAQDLLRREGRL